MKAAENKQQSESENKGSSPKEKEFTFPNQNITIKASSPEEARKKLAKQLSKANDADDGDK